MKKVICACLICAIATASLWGCNPGKNIESKGEEKVHISFSFWEPSIKNDLENALTKIIANYNELHPEVEIRLISKNVNGYEEWMREQFTSNKAPTIISGHVPAANHYFNQGLTVDLNDDLKSPTPYCDTPWIDSFVDMPAVEYLRGTSLAWFDFGVAYYYNVDLYDSLNLEVPETWNEFMHNCKVIKEHGITPIALMAQKKGALEWMWQYVSTGLLGNSVRNFADFDKNRSGSISADELKAIAEAGKEDEFKKEFIECQTAFWEVMREYTGYTKNAIKTDETEAKMEILNGTAAHIMTGSWDLKHFSADEQANVKIGIFKFPSFLEENHKYAGGAPSISGVQALSVSKCGTDEEIAAAKDFLKFLFSEEQYRIFIEETMQLPTMIGYDTKEMKSIFSPTSKGVSPGILASVAENKEYMLKIISGVEFDYSQAAEELYESYYGQN